MSNSDIITLVELYIEAMVADGETVSAPMRSNLKTVAELLPADVTVEEFVSDLPAIFAQILERNPNMPSGSLRARKAAAAALARWSYQERIVRHSPELADRLGMPACMLFADWSESPKALTTYKGLLAEMSVAGLTREDLDERSLSQFLERIPDHMRDWRGGWREFRKRWQALVEDGTLPDIDLPVPTDKKPDRYKVSMGELPDSLRKEVEAVRARLAGTALEDRTGKPLDDSTINLQVGTVLRLLGFLQRERGFDLSRTSLCNALQLANAKALIDYTNRRWCDRYGLDYDADRDVGIGAYEYGQLLQLATVVRAGLQDEALAAEYAEECRFAKRLVRDRREAQKNFGSVDEYLGVACDLIERSRCISPNDQYSTPRALLVRDALIFALQSVFGDRLSVLASLTLSKHVREGENRRVLLCIAKEGTKPGIRDLVREVPVELHGLWREYVDRARPFLLAGERDHKRLWVGQGGSALTSAAIYAAFVTRCLEHGGVRHNPHQTRKALATDYAVWSGGDFLTASAVLDSSPLTLQRHYADLRQAGRVRTFDEQTAEHWMQPEGGAA